MRRWAENDVLDRGLEELQRLSVLKMKIGVISKDSTDIQVRPDGTAP